MKTFTISLNGCATLALSFGISLFLVLEARAVTVTASPTTCANITGIGTVNWANPARAISSNNSFATATVDGSTSRYLRCTGYNFAIPTGATINGITVSVERRSNRITDGGSRDAAMRLVKAGAIGATDRSTTTLYTTADVIEAHGGAADLWGTTWTAAEINAANFGAAFAATKASAAGPSHSVSVDHVQISVDYSYAPGAYSLTASPATCANVTGIGTVNWANPARAISSNDSFATVSVDGSTSRYLRCTAYNFAIPVGATINGITVNVERRSNRTTDGGSRDAAMRLVKAGVIGATDRSTATIYTTADVIEAHGGAADLWGTTWTVAEVNSANFGAAFAATKPSAAGAPHTISVDHMPITITFTIPPPLDHIRLEHDGAALTCTPETVTVKACSDAACSTLYSSGSTTVTLSGAGWATNPITFTGSTTVNLSITTPSTFVLGTTAVTPTPSGTSPVCINSSGGVACNIIFADTGFIFSAIPTQTAGVTSGNVTVQAVRKSDNSTACTGVFTGNVAIDMASQCIDPTTCNGRQVTINSTTIANNPAAGIASYTPVTLNFGGSSTAIFTLNYPDVGNMSLSARYALGGGNFMTGASNTFVVKPFGFTVTGIQRTADGFANPAAGSAAGPKFIHAGESFTATITAIAQGGAATPNFGRELAPEGVLLTSSIVLPAAGANPTLGNGAIAGGGFVNGIATPTSLAWDEVGIIMLTPSVADSNYLGAGNTTGTATGNVGRFVPHHFTALGEVTAACVGGAFTYMAQNFTLAKAGSSPLSGEMLEARNLADAKTANYSGAFAPGLVSFGLENADSGVDLSTRMTAPGSWSAGVYTLSSTNAVFSRPVSTAPDATWGAFDQLEIGITAADADVTTTPRVVGADMNPAAVGCGTGCTYKKLTAAGGIKMRYGRIRLSNAHGSELLPLPVPIKAQYYNGSGFVTNSVDNCTTFTIPVTASPCTTAACVWGDLTLTRVTLDADKTNVTIGNNPLASGVSQFNLSAPLPVGTRGAVDLTLNVPAWLEYNWTGVIGDPKSRATFGLHRKADQFIYQRENY